MSEMKINYKISTDYMPEVIQHQEFGSQAER